MPNPLSRPCLFNGNGPSYIAGELAEYIEANKMSHVRGTPFHPQTQGKFERWHQSLKNRVLPEYYFLPGDLQNQIEAFVEHYNNHRYHKTLDNVTPASANFGTAALPSSNEEKGSSERRSNIGACNNADSPSKHQNKPRPVLRKPTPRIVPNVLTTDTLLATIFSILHGFRSFWVTFAISEAVGTFIVLEDVDERADEISEAADGSFVDLTEHDL